MVKAKKSLGQHFLHNAGAARRICEALDLHEDDRILEIGPGRGALTEILADLPVDLITVEVDSDLAHDLWEKYSSYENLMIVNQDFLHFEMDEFLSSHKWKLIGNLPYNITTPILQRVFNNTHYFDLGVFTVQREVADRMTAELGTADYSSLTVFTQTYSRAKKLFTLKPGSFNPPPKVSSAVIRLNFKSPPFKDVETCQAFNQFVQTVFSYRRKMVLNSLSHVLDLDKETLTGHLKKAGIDPSVRPQNLTLDDFIALFKRLKDSSEQV